MQNHPTRQLPTLTTTAKSINNNTSRYSQQPWTFSIANRKKQELEKTRMKEIQLENMVLKNKISSIRDRRHSQLNRSDRKYLHENLRNQFKRTTKIDNLSHRKRMQEKKATIDTKQLEKQWEDQLIIRKTISKHRRDGDKSSRSVSYNYSGIDKGDKVEKISKQRKMDGLTVQISIQEYSHVLLIWGVVKESGVWVVMVVEREKIQKYFQGQYCRKMMQNIMTGLRFDRQLNTLYYLTDDKDLQEHFISDQCSQFDFSTLRKAIQKQHQTIESKNLKAAKNSEPTLIKEEPSKPQPSPHQDPPSE